MWSIYDTCILITGVISLVVAVAPLQGISPKHRLIGGAVGGGLIVLSLVLGSLTWFTYPWFVFIMPFVAALLVVAVIYQAVRRDQPGAGHGEIGYAMSHARADLAAETEQVDVLATPTSAAPIAVSDGGADAASAADLAAARSAQTTPEELARLAHSSSALWSDIAANPAAYPGLLAWLAQHGGPEIAEIIARRSTP